VKPGEVFGQPRRFLRQHFPECSLRHAGAVDRFLVQHQRAVLGQRTYGKFPTLAINGPDDTNTGRWIPTTACDQFFATLATWFGVDSSNLSTVFPNLGRFATPNLGFML